MIESKLSRATQPCPFQYYTPKSPVVNRGIKQKPSVKPQQLGLFDSAAIAPILKGHAPQYEAVPLWDIEPVPRDESLPGQRYRLVLAHGNLRRSAPIQLRPHEADLLFEAVRVLDCDWRLDLDRTGQIVDLAAAEALRVLFGAVLGGGSDNA